MTALGTALTVAAAVSAGTAGGVYLTFSTMIMPSLRKRPAAEAVATMQRINEMAEKPPFMIVFFGGAATAAAVIFTQLVTEEPPNSDPSRLIGAGLALASFLTTLALNVPRNNALVRNSTNHPATAWHAFDPVWSHANHARGALAILGSAALTASLA